jgi:hypothetical protein
MSCAKPFTLSNELWTGIFEILLAEGGGKQVIPLITVCKAWKVSSFMHIFDAI